MAVSDGSAADPEVVSFGTLLDQLPDNSVGAIGAKQFREIVKSSVGRYLALSVSDHDVTWTSVTTVSLGSATNMRLLANGFTLESGGLITYQGLTPSLVEVDLSMTMEATGAGTYEISVAHTNPYLLLEEDVAVFSIDVADGIPRTASALCTMHPGSKLGITAERTGGTPTAVAVTEAHLGLRTMLLAPYETEIRRGTYGEVNNAGAVDSVLPFTSIYRIIDLDTEPTLPVGSYGLDPAVIVAAGAEYTAASEDVLVVTSGEGLFWSTEPSDGAVILHWTTTPFDTSPTPERPSNEIGDDGDFVAYGYPTDPTVQVWGPKANGSWPIFPRTVSLLPSTT